MPTFTITREDGYASLLASWEKQATEIADLRTALDAMTKRAEAAEARLSVIPWVSLDAVTENVADISDYNEAREWISGNWGVKESAA